MGKHNRAKQQRQRRDQARRQDRRQVAQLHLPDAPTGARVVWSSPLVDGTGYADEARNFLLGLDRLGVDVRAEPIRWSDWGVPLPPEDIAALRRLVDTPAAAEHVRVQHISPLHFVKDPQARFTVGRTMFETDGLPSDWVARCNALDEIWVPTRFNMETFARAGVDPSKLRQVPGAFDADLFTRDLEPLPLNLTPAFTFLSIFDWIPRKGWDVLLRAYLEEFSPADNVRLMLKAYAADGRSGHQELLTRLQGYVRDTLGYDLAQIPEITLLVADYSSTEMAQLYRNADAYVMATRGEGWGRPMMEAMASGLPTIATGWGGSTEFMSADNAYLIDYQLEPIPADLVASSPWFAGQRWAEPSIAHLRQLMREVFSNPATANERGARARAEVIERYSRPAVARILANHLERLLGEPVARTRVAWEGSQFVYHSLAHVNREICLELVASADIDLALIPYEDDQFDPRAEARFVDLVKRITRHPVAPPAVHVRHQWPPRFEPPTSGAWVMIQPWEFGGLPAEWIAPMRDQVDEMWVPTNWVRESYMRSGIPGDKVMVIPNGVDVDRYHPDGPKLPLKTRKRFKFLFVGGTIARKGIDILLQTYLNTFTAADDVCLVIKASVEVYREFSIATVLERIASLPDAPEIEQITTTLTDDEVASLYRACDALVHPYRGEGFGMPIAEAMACELPVIVTGYGACLDFCDGQTALLVPAREVPITAISALPPAGPNGYWMAEPDRDALGIYMRWVAEHPEAGRAIGQRARVRIVSQFTWHKVADLVRERLRSLAQRTPLRFAAVAPVAPAALLLLDGRRSVAFFHHPHWGSKTSAEVLTSYGRAFAAADDVTLVLWLDPRQGVAPDRAVEYVNDAMVAAGVDPDQAPDVLLVVEPLEPPALLQLYAAVDFVVAPALDGVTTARPVLPDLSRQSWRSAAQIAA